jgi:photosystem II stability/assembly factor-like uncharacterized protein
MNVRRLIGAPFLLAAVLCLATDWCFCQGMLPPSKASMLFQGFDAVSSNQSWVWSNQHLWLVKAETRSSKEIALPYAFNRSAVAADAVSAWFENDRAGMLLWISNSSCEYTDHDTHVLCRTVLTSATTRDAGKSWRSYGDVIPDNPPYDHIEQLEFLNLNTGWIVLGAAPGAGREPRVLLATKDGGRSWQVLSDCSRGEKGIGCRSSCEAVAFLSQTEGWLVKCQVYGSPPYELQIFRSHDGGETWVSETKLLQQPNLLPGELSKIFCGEQTKQIIFSALFSSVEAPNDVRSVVFRSENGGSTWQTIVAPRMPAGSGKLPGLSIFSGSFAVQPYRVGAGSRCTSHVLLSRDGGHTWKDVT